MPPVPEIAIYYTNNLGDQQRELLCPIKMMTWVEIPRPVFKKKQAPTGGTELAGFVKDSKRYEARTAELLSCGVFSKEKLVLATVERLSKDMSVLLISV